MKAAKKPTPHLLRTIADLKGDPANPRKISAKALTGLKESLTRFGDLSGLTWNKRTGELVAGHQRLQALKERYGDTLKLDLGHGPTAPAVLRTSDGKGFPIRVVDWDIKTQRAANIAANSPAISGEFDTDLLTEQIKSLASEDAELVKALQFDSLVPLKANVLGKTDPNEIPDTPKTAKTKAGDLYRLGNHFLLCGDSAKAEDVARLMGKERAGLMNTDPPYGVSYANDDRPNPGVAKPRVAKPRVAQDQLQDAKLQAFLEAVFRPATTHALAPNAAWYLWHAHLTQGFFAAAAAAAAANVVLSRQIIWVKPVLLLTRGQYHWKHEPAFFGWIKGQQPPDYGLGNGERTQTTIWEIDGVPNSERKEWNHSTPKPTRLFEIPIIKHLKEGEICYEPFAGTGPQFIAAEQNNRRCFGIEIEPLFCDVIVNRWEKFTSKTAELVK